MIMTNLLIIDDNPNDIDAIREIMVKAGLAGFQLNSSNSLLDALSQIQNKSIDIVLLDLGMSGGNGLNIFKELQKEAPDIPVVVMTGSECEDMGIEAVRTGAQDYLIKGNIYPEVFSHSLRYAIERKQSENKVEHLNRLLFAVRNINQLITTEKEPDVLVEHTCNFLVESHSYNMAWTLFIDENRNIKRVFKAGFHGKFAPLDDQLINNILPECCLRALDENGVIVISDPYSECVRCPLSNHYGNYASLAVKLEHTGKVYGVMVAEIPRALTYQSEEIYLFHEMANDIAFALYSIELDTKRRLTEQALKVSEEKYRAIFEEARDGIVLIEINTGYIVDCNKEFERQTGRCIEELKGMHIWETMIIDQRDITQKKFLNIREKGIGTSGDFYFQRPDNESLPVELVSKVIRIGGKLYIQSLTRDITERKSAEKVLRESEELYKTLVSAIPDAIIMTDLDGEIVFASYQVLTLYGYDKAKEVIGKLLFELIASDQYEKVVLNLQKAKNVGVVKNIEYDMIRKNNTRFIGEISIALVKDANGEPKGYISVIRDITKRKELEDSFRLAHKMEAVGRLAGGIAHDFNNMLTVVLGHCEIMLKMMPGDSLYRKFIEAIEEAGKRSADLTRQLLAFSSKQVLQPRVVNLNNIITELTKILYRIIGEDIELITSLNEELGSIMADPGQIEQAVMNLAINARDAMPDGGKLIIETFNVDFEELYIHEEIDIEPGSYVLLAISDNGCGMERDLKKQIFEPFFTTKEQGKGSGLGLSTVYGIVKQSRGKIWVYSEPGHGTTFKICFPRVKNGKDEKEGHGALTKDIKVGSETILLVEDERFVRELIFNTLSDAGYKMLEADSGEAALIVAKQSKSKVELLLTDVIMPGMNGKVLADKLRSKCPGLKVLYMSGYTDNAIIQYGVLETGMNFIQKPFTPTALKRKLRELLDEK